MFNTILVPMDGSTLGKRALPDAAQLSLATHSRLVLVQFPANPDLTLRARGRLLAGSVAHEVLEWTSAPMLRCAVARTGSVTRGEVAQS
jgi:hypothetical protein